MKQNEEEGTQQVVRVSPASYGIVKVTLSGTAHYLLQLNKHRGVYNFISGHVEADEDEGYFDRAMDREQVEELEGAGFTHSDMAYRVLPSPLVEIDRSSDRYPGLTRYLFKLYQLCFSLSAEELYARAKEDPENAWFTEQELRDGSSASGLKVTAFPVPRLLEELGATLGQLPESCPVPADARACTPLKPRDTDKH